MLRIPAVLMEEHRDAYYHWHRMIDMGVIPPAGNYLLHIDHHDDMECPGYDWNLTSMPRNEREALAFTDRCLGIADFIAPAMWEGTFQTVHILKELIPTRIRTSRISMSLMKGSRGCIEMTDLRQAEQDRDWHADAPWLLLNDEKNDRGKLTREVKYGGLNPDDSFPEAGLVLDVDLDYFCWDNTMSTGEPKRIEITEEAYRSFVEDRDHPLRILATRIVDAAEDQGKYWLYTSQVIPEEPLPDDETILRRMDRLFWYLRRTGVRPAAIDICSSVRSGYLPIQKAAFVQEYFTKKLKENFSVLLI